MHYSIFHAPVGPIGLVSFRGQLVLLVLQESEEACLAEIRSTIGRLPTRRDHLFQRCCDQLNRYFSGEPVLFDEPVLFISGTALQRRIWRHLSDIPYGQVQSYQAVANRLGMKRGARVVGNACAANPLPILIPCHRVVRQNGLGGYRFGACIKRALLQIEGIREEALCEEASPAILRHETR